MVTLQLMISLQSVVTIIDFLTLIEIVKIENWGGGGRIGVDSKLQQGEGLI